MKAMRQINFERMVRTQMKNKKGFVLITTYFLIVSLLTSLTGYFLRSVTDLHLAQRRIDRIQALYTAESGAEQAIDWLRTQRTVPQWTSNSLNGSLSGGLGGSFTAKITRDGDIFWIVSTSTLSNGMSREMRVSVRIQSFANFAYAADQTSANSYFITGSSVTGPFHTNDVIQVYGKPVFNGHVTSSASAVYNHEGGYSSDGNTSTKDFVPVWNDGPPLLNQPRKPFPQADLTYLKTITGIQTLTSQTWIHFNGDGTLNKSTSGPITKTNPGTKVSIDTSVKGYYVAPSSVSSGQPAVVVDGVVDKDFVIASNFDVGISGELTYSCQYDKKSKFDRNSCGSSGPRIDIMSQRNILVMNQAWPDKDVPLHLSGAFAALGGGLKTDYSSHAGKKAEFEVFGSLMEQTQQKKGDLKAKDGKLSTGYQGSYYHDNRLDSQSPLGFPIAISVLSWEACSGHCSAATS